NNDLEYYILLKSSVTEKKTYKELFQLAYNIATSKIILLEDYYPLVYPLKIKKNSELIQLWHAVGAFKKFGYSRSGKPGGPLVTSRDHRNYTKVIVSAESVRPFYAEGFGVPMENVVPTGIPRTDIFFDNEYKRKISEMLYRKYPFIKNKKVILYAPTFRGNGQQSAFFPFKQLDLVKIYNALKEDCIFIIKMHPFVKDRIDIPDEFKHVIFDFTHSKENINDMLFITDILVTDYSSVCFEFGLLNKPMIFYCFDLEEYTAARDFYTPFKEFVPGPICTNSNELIDSINVLKKENTLDQSHFTSKYFDHFDGKSTKRVTVMIEKILKVN